MKLTYGEILSSIDALKTLAEKELSYKTALKISRNIDNLDKHIQDYQKEFIKIADKYFKKDETGNYVTNDVINGTSYEIIEGEQENCNNDLEELNNFLVDVEIYTIVSDELDNISMTPICAKSISFMIEE